MPSAFDTKRFENAWERYLVKASESHSGFPRYLHKGATDAQIVLAEQEIGCEFSPDLRFLLTRHDGSENLRVLPGWMLFSADRIVSEWRIWEDLYRTQFKPAGYDCDPVGPVRPEEWWRLRWIPFCGDGSGNHLCVDMDPAPGGEIGQIITMWHDNSRRELVARSLTEYVEFIAAEFERDRLTWNPDRGGICATKDL